MGCQIGPSPEEALIMRNVACQTELMVLKCEHKEAEREETIAVVNTVRDFSLHKCEPVSNSYFNIPLLHNSANYCFVTHY